MRCSRCKGLLTPMDSDSTSVMPEPPTTFRCSSCAAQFAIQSDPSLAAIVIPFVSPFVAGFFFWFLMRPLIGEGDYPLWYWVLLAIVATITFRVARLSYRRIVEVTPPGISQ